MAAISTNNNNKSLITESFRNIVENMNVDEKIYEKYFSPDYVQYVDGKEFNYSDLIHHMKAQKGVINSAKVTVKYIVAEQDKVSTIHIVEGVTKDGKAFKVQVNALFIIRDNKIILCDELTHSLLQDKFSKELGSIK